MPNANLSGAYLGGANLSGADLSHALLGGADLSGADLSGADLSAAIGLTTSQLIGTELDDQTKLPPDVAQPTSSTSPSR